MVTGDWKYLRFLDDIHVLGRTRREVSRACVGGAPVQAARAQPERQQD